MSMSRSASIDSSASTATATTFSHVDLPVDSSNGLYEDREHFQAIFTNDSRFFDTSLHLFKSYYELGYISADEDKSNNLPVPTLSSATSRTSKHRWRPRLLRLHHDHPHDNHHGTIKGFLTPILLRRTDQSSGMQTESATHRYNETKTPQPKHSLVVHYQQAAVPTISITDETKSDESEVTVTRL